MEESLYFNGKKFISSRRASDLTGYTLDYIGQLARSKKVESQMVGRNRYVSESSIIEYKNSNSIFSTDPAIARSGEPLVKNEVNRTISPERDSMQGISNGGSRSSNTLDSKTSHILYAVPQHRIIKSGILISILVLSGIFITSSRGSYGLSNFIVAVSGTDTELFEQDKSMQLSLIDATSEPTEGLKKIDNKVLGFFERIDSIILGFIKNSRNKILAILNPRSTTTIETRIDKNEFVASSTSVASSVPIADEESLRKIVREIMLKEVGVFAPEPQFSEGVISVPQTGDPITDQRIINQIKNSFSDEVVVTLDSSKSSGVIQPVFRNSQSGAFMFVMVPINK